MTTALTDADLTYFWLGPLGYLQQLPLLPVAGSTSAPETLIGAVQTSMTGAITLDVFGHKRTWDLAWVCLTHTETSAVHAWYQGLSTAPLRLIDPRAGNWLTRDGASGGSYHRDTRAHTPTSGSGTVAYTTITDYPTPIGAMVDGGITWTVPAATTAALQIDTADRIPLIPDQQITITLWLKGTGNAQVGAQFYDVSGATYGNTLSAVQALGGWAEYQITVTPTAGQVSATVMVIAASGSSRTITIGPGSWHPTNTDWVPGTGCPVVVLTDRKTTYPGLANQDTTLTVREV